VWEEDAAAAFAQQQALAQTHDSQSSAGARTPYRRLKRVRDEVTPALFQALT